MKRLLTIMGASAAVMLLSYQANAFEKTCQYYIGSSRVIAKFSNFNAASVHASVQSNLLGLGWHSEEQDCKAEVSGGYKCELRQFKLTVSDPDSTSPFSARLVTLHGEASELHCE